MVQPSFFCATCKKELTDKIFVNLGDYLCEECYNKRLEPLP